MYSYASLQIFSSNKFLGYVFLNLHHLTLDREKRANAQKFESTNQKSTTLLLAVSEFRTTV
jgi:hypothetical protein